MSKSIVLNWYDDSVVSRDYTWMDRFITYFGMEMQLIDPAGVFKRESGRFPVVYYTLDEALDALKDLTWVFLDSQGEYILDEFDHPMEQTVYAFGANVDGFGKSLQGLGHTVKLRLPDEIYALHALPIVLYDRALKLAGRK